MANDPKARLSIILGKPPKDGSGPFMGGREEEGEDDMEEGDEEMPDTDAIASEVMDALKAEDAAAFSDALYRFVEACK